MQRFAEIGKENDLVCEGPNRESPVIDWCDGVDVLEAGELGRMCYRRPKSVNRLATVVCAPQRHKSCAAY